MMNEWILSSSLLIAAVLVGRRLLRGKISLRLQYALWGIVLLRLLLPVQLFTSDFGAGAIAEDMDLSEPLREVYFSANEDRYELAYDEAYQWAADAYASSGETADPFAIEQTARDMAQADLELDLQGLLTGIWLGGMAVMSATIALCNLHLGRRLRASRREDPAEPCLLPVYVTDALPTPCIFGLFRPVIYLTPEAAKDEKIRSHVLAHEQTHYRHGDHIWSVLRTLCLVLHWYNPLVRIAVKASKIDAELACDEGVLARLGEHQRGDYGRTLIGLTCSTPMGDFLMTATTMTGSAGSIRQRIKLLMQRPRNTLLALTAVILVGMLVVGCSFAGAPETTPPATEPREPAETTEPIETQPNRGDPERIAFFQGLLEPYNSWYAQALTSYYDHPAGIDLFQLFYNGIPGADNTPGKEELAFLENQPGYNPDFDLIRIPGHEMDRVLGEYLGIDRTEVLGLGLENFLYDAQSDCYYHCHTDTNAGCPTVTAAQELSNGDWQVLYTGGFPGDGVVTLRQRDGTWQILSNLPIGTTPPALSNKTDVVRSLLGKNGDPDNLAALTRLWSGHYGIAESKHVDPFIPGIVDCVQADADTIYVYYNRPGSGQLYQAELAPHADSWAVIDNVMVLSMADYADKNLRELTEEELQQFRSAFRAVREDSSANPAACFLATCYSDITQMDGSEFLAYFPTDREGTREEFELLKAKYPDFFEEWTWDTMPLPIHRYSAKEIEAVVSDYANIHWPELDEGVHYLDETGCYYNYTSDFGLGGFYAKGGWVYDGGAVVYSGFSVLFFDETMGQYSIRAHLPAIVLGLPSSQPMIPAPEVSDPRDPDIIALVTAFNRAYQENLYMGTDNPYDHLTVLAVDPEITVTHQGQTVPLSDFYRNIEYLHDKETWFHHTRSQEDVTQAEYTMTCQVNSILYDDSGDTAIAVTSGGVVFADDDPAAPSGEGAVHKFLLVRVDGIWLVADVLADGEGFDLKYKDNPTFDVEKMIAERFPG